MVVHGPYPVGEPRVAREVRTALDEGYEVDVVAMRRPGDAPEELVDGARVLRLPLDHRRGRGTLGVVWEYAGFAALASLRVATLTARRRYALVQVHNPPDFLMLAAVLPKLLGARIIFDIHDLSPDMFAMRFEGRRGAAAADRALRVIERWATRFADAVVTVHEPYRRELISRGVPAAKTSVVMNSLDERLLPPPATGPRNDGFRIVYHGSITPPYGVHLLVEAVAKITDELPDVALEIYGEGDAAPAVRARAEELGISERVKMSGRYLPLREVLEHVRWGSVGVIPNLPTRLNRFALSSKLFEYVALGVPVVVANLPTLAEHFSEQEVLFFEAGDAGALADALLAVARDGTSARARADAARRRYEDYRWPLNSRRYAALLNAVGDSAQATSGRSGSTHAAIQDRL